MLRDFIWIAVTLCLLRPSELSAQDIGARIVYRAQQEIGVRELTGHNDGRQVALFLKSVNLSIGNPWCAAFIAYVLDQLHLEHPKSGYCPNWFVSNVVYRRGPPGSPLTNVNAGDVFGIYFESKHRIAHVGIIEQVTKGYIITIEGNTNEAGSREGDGVYRKKRLPRQIYAVSRWNGGTGWK